MLQMLQKRVEILVNITNISGICLLNSLKIPIKIGSLAMFEVNSKRVNVILLLHNCNVI